MWRALMRLAVPLTLNVTIPANTTATVLVPAKSADVITENPESFRGWRKPPA